MNFINAEISLQKLYIAQNRPTMTSAKLQSCTLSKQGEVNNADAEPAGTADSAGQKAYPV
ncbi:MAG TPA: hypothetical protein VNO70_05400 [Blastocatellia bacterium]|nr:hypothetical protein [Blastocatellia bacterium]